MPLMLTSHLCVAVLLRCLSVCVLMRNHVIGGTRLVSQYLSLVDMWCGMRIAHRLLGARIIIGQDGRFSLPSVCMLSWVMVRRTSLSMYMPSEFVSGEVLSEGIDV